MEMPKKNPSIEHDKTPKNPSAIKTKNQKKVVFVFVLFSFVKKNAFSPKSPPPHDPPTI